MIDYLAFGDLGVDSMARIDHLPRPDEKVWVEPIGDYPGGMIGNAAATAAALGARVGVVALLGDDRRGDLVFDDLTRRGIDVRFVQRIHAPTFWTLSLTTPDGDRSLIQFPTPAFGSNWEGFDPGVLSDVRWVHTTAEQGDPVGQLLRRAKEHGSITSLDVEYPFVQRSDLADLLRLTDVAFFNREAAEALGGPETAGHRATELGVDAAVVTLGDHGCFLKVEDESRALARVPVEAVDSNGAGDAFAGAFAVARLRGWSHVASAEFANVVAAVSTTGLGGHGSELDAWSLSDAARAAGYSWAGKLP